MIYLRRLPIVASTCRIDAQVEPGTDRCGFLGYVFRNVHSDGDALVDGQEWLLGTNPNNADSDGDGYDDSEEHLPYCCPFVKDVRTQSNHDRYFKAL